MKHYFLRSKQRRLAGLAPSLLLLMAAATPARADGDLIDYRDTVRYHDELARRDGRTIRPAIPPHVAYLQVTRRPAARVIVSGDAPKPAASGGYFVVYPNAEATGAAQGQTVNRATNDLD